MHNSKTRTTIGRLLHNNNFVLVLSIVLAIVFWLTVSISQSKTITKTITDVTVNIDTEGTSVGALGLDVVSGGTTQKVSVKVSGPSYLVSNLTAADILVTAGLSRVTAPGTYQLPLTVTQNSAASGYDIIGVTPDLLEVTFDNTETRTFTTMCLAEGATAPEGLVAEEAIVADTTSSTIEITGPKSVLDTIETVQAYAKVNKTLESSATFEAAIRLLDVEGNEIDQTPFTLSYTTVDITVPISRKATLPVKPTFVNLPSVYTEDTVPFSLSTSSVTILGPPEVVDAMRYVELKPIDFTEVSSGSLTFQCALNLASGIKNMDNVDSVMVTLNFSDLTEAAYTVSSVQVINLEAGLTANFSTTIKNVKLCGSAADLSLISDADIYAEVDLSGKPAGEYTVSANIIVPGYGGVWQVGTYNVIVTISKS